MLRFIALLSVLSAGSIAVAATGDPPGSTASNPTQAQVLHVLITANKAEVDDGKVAMTKASHARVKELADHMVKDHGAALEKLDAMTTKNAWKPLDNEWSQKLDKQHQDDKSKLASMDGVGFDRQYVALQVKMHKDLLDLMDNKLIPNITDPTFKTSVVEMRATVAEHLAHAQQIQTDVKELNSTMP